ncbi:MAG: GTPase Obg [Syntrophorhabdus sp. PtaU1.Bin153]|nr:MAG: GTPase Obg [Syntrophorhabdus sp. PtaU1.Bin153]
MKFVDEATIYVKAGDGGQGCASFRREKFVPKGGPDGGDGGKGGDVVISGTKDLASLLDFKYRHIFRAEKGKNGSGSNKRGRDGKDLHIRVPLGTMVFQEDDPVPVCDVTRDDNVHVVAKGGRGGKGNARFVTSTHRAPLEFEPGEIGEEKNLRFVLKLLADVGIVGLPNAGKSTLISRLTEAKPRIGDYPFTTLTPTLGVLRKGDNTFVMADIPGIVEGASQGKGLGLTFLKHIERTAMLLLVLDLSTASVERDYETLRYELNSFKPGLFDRERIVVLNKMDKVTPEEAKRWEVFLTEKGETFAAVSALEGWGIEELKTLIKEKGLDKVISA